MIVIEDSDDEGERRSPPLEEIEEIEEIEKEIAEEDGGKETNPTTSLMLKYLQEIEDEMEKADTEKCGACDELLASSRRLRRLRRLKKRLTRSGRPKIGIIAKHRKKLADKR